MIILHRPKGRLARAGFTLIELLLTVCIIAIMSSMALVAFQSATDASKAQKTKALITKLDAIIKNKWDNYKTRRVPIDLRADQFLDGPSSMPPYNGIWDSGETITVDHNANSVFDPSPQPIAIPSSTNTLGTSAAKMRLDSLRDLMRMELPDRWTDVASIPIAPFDLNNTPNWAYAQPFKVPRPSANQSYYRRYMSGTPSPANQNAECLYLIVMAALEQEGDSRDVFKPGDTGDTDGDGFQEFVDGWGQPIKFLRWAPGFTSELQVAATGYVAGASGGGQSVTLTFNIGNPSLPADQLSPGMSTASGAYVGGAIAVQDTGVTSPQLLASSLTRIVSYSYNPSTYQATMVCATPSYTMQQPFSGSPPGSNALVYIMAPDPFDPAGVYPVYSYGSGSTPSPNTSIPSFALYPLIYSAGPDKAYGIVADTAVNGVGALDYTLNALQPFTVDSSGRLIGTTAKVGTEPDYAWVDNVHNHMIGTK